MLTEDRARELLRAAAATVEVGPSAPVEPARRRTWPLLAAAVATLLAGAGVWALADATAGRDADPQPAVDLGPVRPGEVPNVFGYRRAGAVALLTDAGYDVDVRLSEPSCSPDGRAVATEPGPGAALAPGSRVALTVTRTWATADCFSPEHTLWSLLDFAQGRGPVPPTAEKVVTYVDGRRVLVEDPADPGAWGEGGALDTLARAAQVAPRVERALVPSIALGAGDNPPGLPDAVADRPAEWGRIAYDESLGEAEDPQVTVSVLSGRRGIDTVVVDTQGLPEEAARPTDADPLEPVAVPSVFGHDRDAATRILAAAGLEVQVTVQPSCVLAGQAVGTLPSTGVMMVPGSTVTLRVAEPARDAFCPADFDVPSQLLGLATGEVSEPDLLTGSLTAYLDGERRDVADASEPAAWGEPSALDALRAAVDWSPAVPRTWRTLEAQEPGCRGEAFRPPAPDGATTQRYAIAFDDPGAPCVQLTVVGRFGRPPTAVAVETTGLVPVDEGQPDSVPLATAQELLDFARGDSDEPPLLADEVRLYDRGDYRRTVPAAELADRGAWVVCDTGGSDTCAGSALDLLSYAGAATPVDVLEDLPDGAAPGTAYVVVVGPTLVTSCQPQGEVRLGLDERGAVLSVDVSALLVPDGPCSDGGIVPAE